VTRLSEIQAHIGSLGELRNIVGAMRALAGMRVQEAQQALPGIRRYTEAIAVAVADTLHLLPQPAEPRHQSGQRQALILCAAEHGFVGGFNERLVMQATAELGSDDFLFVLGSRGAALAFERGRKARWTAPMATRCAAVPETIQRLTRTLYSSIARGDVGRVDVMFARYHAGTAAAVERRTILPLDLKTLRARQSRLPPLHNLPPVALHERLLAEYVFALLAEAAAESIASENAARFAAMASAHDNVSKKLDDLRRDAQQARQADVTNELLELVAGAEALAGER
jgi:F-type H+-transporting ATPase subunit gamma